MSHRKDVAVRVQSQQMHLTTWIGKMKMAEVHQRNLMLITREGGDWKNKILKYWSVLWLTDARVKSEHHVISTVARFSCFVITRCRHITGCEWELHTIKQVCKHTFNHTWPEVSIFINILYMQTQILSDPLVSQSWAAQQWVMALAEMTWHTLILPDLLKPCPCIPVSLLLTLRQLHNPDRFNPHNKGSAMWHR